MMGLTPGPMLRALFLFVLKNLLVVLMVLRTREVIKLFPDLPKLSFGSEDVINIFSRLIFLMRCRR